MGGIFGTLGQIGEAQAGAEELRRKRDIENAYATIQRQYATTNLARSQVELMREQRLERQASMPAYLGTKDIMGVPFVIMQNPKDGSISWNRVPDEYLEGFRESSSAAEDVLNNLPPESQLMARAIYGTALTQGGPAAALKAIQGIAQDYAKKQIPGLPTETTMTATESLWDPTKTTVIRKQTVPPGGAKAPAGKAAAPAGKTAAAPSAAAAPIAPELMPGTPTLPIGPKGKGKPKFKPLPTPANPSVTPVQAEGSAKKLGWTWYAPSPAYYEPNPKDPKHPTLAVPRSAWGVVEEWARQLIKGGKPPTESGNAAIMRRNAIIMARAREMGWKEGQGPTNSMRDAAEWARKALSHMGRIRQLIKELDDEKQLGPLAGRMNHFLTYSWGADENMLDQGPYEALSNATPSPKHLIENWQGLDATSPNYPKYVELSSTLALMATALMRAHVGARGGVRLLDEFVKQWDPGKMSAATLNASLDTMESFLTNYSQLDSMIEGGGPGPAPAAPPVSREQLLQLLSPERKQ